MVTNLQKLTIAIRSNTPEKLLMKQILDHKNEMIKLLKLEKEFKLVDQFSRMLIFSCIKKD